MNDRPLIGLTGHKGAGKDSVATILREEYGYVRRAFADALRNELAETIYGNGGDERSFALREGFLCHIEKHKYDDPGSPTGWPRMLMQAWGTMRRGLFGQDYWIGKVPLCENVVISDVRFPNEATAIKAAGGVLWRVDRPGYSGDGHVSEQSLYALPVDWSISNHRGLDSLADQIRATMERMTVGVG